ncbi:MAG: 4Fe-4S binding protein [Candidatus Aminicenantes bacterium]|nr:4Fe-4S binding protein [Candidatus Aminicenantes bacterium]
MKRKIIKIDEEKCNGCGLCIPDCPEGALQIIDNKARLVSDLFCDGLGACLGTCPEGAISVEEREAEPYDERKVMENIVKQGPNVIKAHLDHLSEHNETEFLKQAKDYLAEKGIETPREEKKHTPCACPGSALKDMRDKKPAPPQNSEKLESTLQNWPVQLGLLSPYAPYLKNADLLVSADCVPFAYADFHRRFLQGKIMLTFCPKLDHTIEEYIEKLTAIFKEQNIKSVTVLHMEVPCCSGTLRIVEEALKSAGKVIPIKDYTISISGEII